MRIVSGWRWLGRMALVGLVLTLLAALAWAAWLWETQRRMERTIAEIRARGEMVQWSELEIATVPDEQNAAWYLNQAGLVIVPAPPGPSAFEAAKQKMAGLPTTRPTAEEKTQAQLAANAKALTLLRQARGCTRNTWVNAKPASGPPIPTYTNQSALAKLARETALERHRAGDDREAVELWRDIEAQSRSIGDGKVLLIGGLMALIIDGIGTDALLTIAPELRIGDDGLTVEEVRKVILELLDDGHIREAVARGWKGGLLNWTDIYLAGQPLSPMTPLLNAHLQKLCAIIDRMAADTLALRESPPFEVDEYVRLIGVIPQFGGVSRDVMNYTLRRWVTAVALAMRLFHAEQGRYPERLEDLVPAYLPEVPVDPVNGGALRYVLERGGRRPVVYAAPEAMREWEARRNLPAKRATGAMYFDASPWDGSAQGVEDHDKQPGDGGQKQ